MGLVLFDALQNVLRDVDLGVDLHVDAVQLFGNVVQVDLEVGGAFVLREQSLRLLQRSSN